MTRKRKPPVQQKRQQVTDSSGWTHIVKGPKSDMATISQLPSQRLETSLTVEVYASKFRMMYSPQWQESPCLQSLRRLFEHDILPAENITLSNCVCLGLGSLTVGTPTSSYELVALTSMLEMMSTKHNIQEVVFQDPAFNAQDKSFLASLGYTVLDDPQAFAKIDDNTFLFAPHLEVGPLATALENSAPAVCISNDMSGYVTGLYRRHAEEKKADSPYIFEHYLSQTVCKAMPEFDRTTWARETNIYWLKESK